MLSKPVVFIFIKVPKFSRENDTFWISTIKCLTPSSDPICGTKLRSPYNEVKRTTRARLVGALTEHYGSPGGLADYRRQFENTIRQEGEDPSTFTITLETLAVKAFGDMGANPQL